MSLPLTEDFCVQLLFCLPSGRYPIHFHLSGDVTGSYVRGCAIHHTFNRAVTVHGVTGVLVEHNVAYNVMGHAFFIEDGIETGNTIQYNLGVFIKTSSSLLITDVTPAAFWVTNPNNTGEWLVRGRGRTNLFCEGEMKRNQCSLVTYIDAVPQVDAKNKGCW